MAEEKTFSVGVQTSSPKRISVTSNVSENPITASADTGLYYSQLAKNWAIGEGLIQNEDYSSKTWAGESKSSADLSKMYSEAASLDLNNLENKIIEYDEQLNTTITDGLDNINTSVTSGVETIETLQANSIAEITTNKETALNDITTAETNVLANIDTSKLNTLAQIEELANSSIEDINATGIDTKVSKSGDTMTGSLNFQKSNTLDFTNTNNTVYTEAGAIYFRDKNEEISGQIRNCFNEYNNLTTSIDVRRSVNGTIKTAKTQLYVDKDGNANFNFPKCTTKATTTSSARNDLVAVVVQNYVSGTSWYRVWSDGWIEQGGHVSADGYVTLLKAFSTTNYSITFGGFNTGTNNNGVPRCVKKQTSQFMYSSAGTANCPANWRASGY